MRLCVLTGLQVLKKAAKMFPTALTDSDQSVQIQIQHESVSTDTDVQTHSVKDVKTHSVSALTDRVCTLVSHSYRRSSSTSNVK